MSTRSQSPFITLAYAAFVGVAAVCAYSFVSVAKEGETRRRCAPTCLLKPNYAGFERLAPRFNLKDTKGQDVSLESFRGKVVVLNFWTKSCGPCMEEMPALVEMTHILSPMSDVAVVTVSTDESAEDAKATLRTVVREQVPFAVLVDSDLKVVRDKFGTSLYPETWIIDKRGVVRARFDGPREWSSAAVVELITQIRDGEYCPVGMREGNLIGEARNVCESLTGG